MNVFFYDKTFDGLLTTVFDAYKLKLFPDKLLEMGDIAPMLMEQQFTSVTQPEKAARVWRALKNKLSTRAINHLLYAWQSDHPEFDQVIFRYICRAVITPKSIETDFADPDVNLVFKLAKQVSRECHYLIEFVRFQKTVDDVYFSPVAPRYDVLPFTMSHFKDRFSDQKWVIYDEKRGYGYYYDLHKITEMNLDDLTVIENGKLKPALLTEDELLFQTLWQRYFKALTIEERKNLKQQRRSMPKRFWHYLTELQ